MMKKIKFSAILLVLIAMGTIENAKSQTYEDAVSAFPESHMVYSRYERKLRLYMKNGEPQGESSINIDMLMLTDKVSLMRSKYRVIHSGFNELANLEAYTKVPSGNRFTTHPVKNFQTSGSPGSNVFYDDVKETLFDFPNLAPKAIAHVGYTLKHKDIHLLMPLYIPDELPILQGRFSLEVADGIKVNFMVKNDPDGIFQFSEERKGRNTIYTWTIKNYKPDEYFSDAPGFRHYQPHVIVHVTEYQSGKNQATVFAGLKDLYNWNYGFLKEINTRPDPLLKNFTDSLVKNISDPLAKAEKIYQWVQQHIRYIAFENGLEGFTPRQAADIFQKRYGDCKDMASILTEMLRMAGLNAYFTWIGTRDIPYRYAEVPLPIVDNHMITTLNLNNKWYFLDATNAFAQLELPPSSIQGKETLVAISAEEFKVLKVPEAPADRNIIIDSTFITLSPAGITGFQKVDYTGYFGQDVNNAIRYRSEKEKEKYVKTRMGKGSNKFILGKYEIDQSNMAYDYANISARFEIPDYSKKIGEDYYINLNLEKLLENRVVETDKRKVPIENEFRYTILQHHILNIPENYEVAHFPEDFVMENDLIKVSIRYKQHQNRLIATQEVISKTLLITPDQFPAWNKMMQAIQPRYKETIVLKSTSK